MKFIGIWCMLVLPPAALIWVLSGFTISLVDLGLMIILVTLVIIFVMMVSSYNDGSYHRQHNEENKRREGAKVFNKAMKALAEASDT